MQQEMIRFMVSEFMDQIELGSDSITALIHVLENGFTEVSANYTSDKTMDPYNMDTHKNHIKNLNLSSIGKEMDKVSLHVIDEDTENRYYNTSMVVWKCGEE